MATVAFPAEPFTTHVLRIVLSIDKLLMEEPGTSFMMMVEGTDAVVNIPAGAEPADLVDLVFDALEIPLHEATQPVVLILRRKLLPPNAAETIPISIYLDNEAAHERVEAAVDNLLATADLIVEERNEPVIGSWFRTLRATAKQAAVSPAGREAVLTATHAADTRLILAQDAQITATLLQNLAPVLQSLQPTKDAVLRIGALLIVKVDWTVQVVQLTAAQQAVLDHRPHLAKSPHDIVEALELSCANIDIEAMQPVSQSRHPASAPG
jgi:hypothetical protein